ncbi:hypothetical protein J0S26_21275 [Escherichia coli]|nr:hypothetical protein [Escherichia coli]
MERYKMNGSPGAREALMQIRALYIPERTIRDQLDERLPYRRQADGILPAITPVNAQCAFTGCLPCSLLLDKSTVWHTQVSFSCFPILGGAPIKLSSML